MNKKVLSVVACALMAISSVVPASKAKAAFDGAPSTIPAFPGAEGGGMYASGGRGYDVYEVTNLNDSGPGSLRDAISESNRMVVFRVSGTINLQSPLKFSYKKNITIAGQTAPGDGICIAGYETNLSDSENIIIRYLRFRAGSAHINEEPDALGARGAKYLMIDHVSTSWSTDETMSFYGNKYTTVQWSIVNESLTLSGHFKGKHGYGGIWGGDNSSFHHNIMATHSSRMPRLGNGTIQGNMDMTNNVFYNWGFNNTYGGTYLDTNTVGNYYKSGPSTQDSVKDRILNPGDPARYYMKDNYSYGNPSVNSNNMNGVHDKGSEVVFQNTPIENDSYATLTIQGAEEAYNEVLAKAGAVLPRRDAVDARIIQDIKNGTGRIINREYEVGGYPELRSEEAPVDTDHDGMPDEWEIAQGLNPNDKEDGKIITASGYSNLELYLNYLADMNHTPDNPVAKITTPKYNDIYAAGGQMTIDAEATDKDGIAKVEFYKNDIKVGEDLEAPYSFTLENVEEGTYFISVRAYDKLGNATQSTSMPVHVNGVEVTAPWKSVDIGSVPVKGSGSLDANGILTVKGSGKINGKSDKFHFVYQPISGNASLTARLDSIALLDNNAISGLMIRESLDVDAATAIISTSTVKADRDENGDNSKDDTYFATYFSTRTKKGEAIKSLGYEAYPQDYIPGLLDHTLPLWLKIERVENEIVAFTSTDGTTWNELSRKTINMGQEAYIGFAVDATQPAMAEIYYNTAKFSNVQLVNSFTVTDLKLTNVFGKAIETITPGMNVTAEVTVNKNSTAIKEGVIAIQICDVNDKVISTSYVKSSFTNGQTKNVKASFSTPKGLTGIKVKAFVVNNINAGMKISNEFSVR